VEANAQMLERLSVAEDKLEQQARQIETHVAEACTDPLTQLANRRAFDKELKRRAAEFQRRGTLFAVLLADVDHFKKFNDTHGHQAGDEVLRVLAAIMRQTMREMDLVARYGGEEFAAILPATKIDDAVDAAERVRKAVETAQFRFEGRQFRITVSLGVAQAVENEHASLLLRRVDEALYASKADGRNCTHYYAERSVQRVDSERTGDSTRQCATTQQESCGADSSLPEPSAESESAVPGCSQSGLAVASAPSQDDQSFCLVNQASFRIQVRGRIAEWKRGGSTFTLMFLKIGGYDGIVQAGDPNTGDRVVKMMERLLHAAVREMDIAAQSSPDCFTILLPRTSRTDAMIVAERLQREFAEQAAQEEGGRRAELTLSIGLAEVMEGDDLVRLFERSETALTAGKQSGPSGICFHNGRWAETVSASPQAVH
jgi:diguanylate cyclase